MEFTPINVWRLSKRGKEIFEECSNILKHNVKKVSIAPNDFMELLEGISLSIRKHYNEAIPLNGKIVVRK
jgi:hypothetical protein